VDVANRRLVDHFIAQPNGPGGTVSINADSASQDSTDSIDFQILDTDSTGTPDTVDFDVTDNDDVSDSKDVAGISDGGSVTFDSGLTFDVALADDLSGTDDLQLTAATSSIAVREGTFDASEGPFPIYYVDENSDGVDS